MVQINLNSNLKEHSLESYLTGKINKILVDAFKKMNFPTESAFAVRSTYPEIADLQCNAMLKLGKLLKKNPMELANAIVEIIKSRYEFSNVFSSEPGFINLKFSDDILNTTANYQIKDNKLGVPLVENESNIIIDFGGPNVAKPLHVGHLRSLIIGESIRRILQFQDYRVISDIHLGDWGLQMGMLISEIEIRYPNLSYFNEINSLLLNEDLPFSVTELENLYPDASNACKNDQLRLEKARLVTAKLQAGNIGYLSLWEKLRKISLDGQLQDLNRLGVHFDLLDGESDVQPLIPLIIESLLKKNIAKESNGALIIDVANEIDKKPMPPLILQKTDGSALYSTTDIATILDRQNKFSPKTILYVVDQRQSLHFEQVFRVAFKAGYVKKTDLVHIGFGTVNGPDNKPYKTRDGGVARLSDLLNEAIQKARSRLKTLHNILITESELEVLATNIGLAAVKFADLDNHRLLGYIFDADRLVSFEGRTGPFIQYSCVRIRSILNKVQEAELIPSNICLSEPIERLLLLECSRFPDCILSATKNFAPNEITNYAFNLAQIFNRFYKNCPVINISEDEIRSSRISICILTNAILTKCLWLLGIEVPSQM